MWGIVVIGIFVFLYYEEVSVIILEIIGVVIDMSVWCVFLIYMLIGINLL